MQVRSDRGDMKLVGGGSVTRLSEETPNFPLATPLHRPYTCMTNDNKYQKSCPLDDKAGTEYCDIRLNRPPSSDLRLQLSRRHQHRGCHTAAYKLRSGLWETIDYRSKKENMRRPGSRIRKMNETPRHTQPAPHTAAAAPTAEIF